MAGRTFNDQSVDFIAGLTERNLADRVEKHDALGMFDYVRALGDFILECATPMTIGIQGDWGIGKTSTLNMLDGYLKVRRGEKPKVIRFNTWHYSLFNQDDLLGAAVINALLDELKRNFKIEPGSLEQGKKAIGRVMNALSGISVGGFNIDAKKMLEDGSSMESHLGYQDIAAIMLDFRQRFAGLVRDILADKSNNASRLVFFIDDLDRVKPAKAIELLESIKNFLDVPDCVFVIAVDYEVVQIGMAEKLGVEMQNQSGKSFFDKLIQLPFTMPSGSYDLTTYVKRLLESCNFIGGRELKDHEAKYYAKITSCTVGRNPRSIKRAANYALLLEKVRSYNKSMDQRMTFSDRQVLYAMICMQIAWPEIFDYFIRNPTADTISELEDWNYLERIPNIKKLWRRSRDIDQVKSNIGAFFDLLFGIVDTDNDGTISNSEFAAIWKVLTLTKLTTAEDFQTPYDLMAAQVRENAGGGRCDVALDALMASKWKSSHRVDFKFSGNRYGTLVLDRRQAGTIVSLRSRPFAMRLVCDPANAKADLEQRLGNAVNVDEIVLSSANMPATGFGDTFLVGERLCDLGLEDAIRVLNALFEFIASNFE